MVNKKVSTYSGPHIAVYSDIPDLNKVFSSAFGDRYRKDGMIGVHVPPLNPAIWRYAIENAGDGAMIWRDATDLIVGFSICHLSGVEGWMGPIAVTPLAQGLGLGKLMVREGVKYLKSNGARVIGLETMPRTMDNIGFYSGLGFVPQSMTITLSLDAAFTARQRVPQVSMLKGADKIELVARCAYFLGRVVQGYDFTKEILLTDALSLGDTLVIERDGSVVGFALCHYVPLVEGRTRDEVRVLKLVAQDLHVCDELIDLLCDYARRVGARRIAIRAQSEYTELYKMLIAKRAKVRWTDLRMAESSSRELGLKEAVLLSNWEI